MTDTSIPISMKTGKGKKPENNTAAGFMSYLKTNRENIQEYNDKLLSEGAYTYVEAIDGTLGAYPEGVTIPPTSGEADVADIIENSLHQLHHDERQVKEAKGGVVKDDLEDKFLAWHREHLFKSLAAIARDVGFDVTPQQFETELNGEINAILAVDPKAGELTVLDKLLDEYPADK